MNDQIETIIDDPKLRNKIASIKLIDDLSLVFVELTREAKVNTKNQIIKQINDLFSYEVIFHTDSSEHALSGALTSHLIEQFGEDISIDLLKAVSTKNKGKIDVFGRLSLSSDLDSERVLTTTKSFFSDNLKLECRLHFDFRRADNVPSALLLGQIKQYAPIILEDLKKRLGAEEVEVSEKNLKKALDALRKKGFILFQRERGYVLTAKGLAALPVIRNRNSSDITRLLWIARNGL